jgi:uncharacterized protein (TIGR02452 family)
MGGIIYMNGKGNREARSKIAKNTLKILESGEYVNRLGATIDIREALKNAVENSLLYNPDNFRGIEENIDKLINERKGKSPKIEITDETTIRAARRLVVCEGITDTVCLNFASAKNPGGGFLNGSQAQEESLSRASGLYPCISQMNEMYEYNRSLKTCFYSDYMIYSPKVPVFRDDNDALIEEPYLVSFITAPAVNAGVVMKREPGNREKIHSVMVERIKKILSIAALNNNKAIVLGAYGCGVFRNRTEDVAEYFRRILHEDGFKFLFDKIVFAVYDNSANKDKVRIFKSANTSGDTRFQSKL